MKEIECTRDLLDNLTRFPLAEVIPLLNSAQQLATVDFLENEVEFFIILEELNELNDVRMSLAVVESLHFLEHSGSSMTWNFVDDLYRIFQIGVQ